MKIRSNVIVGLIVSSLVLLPLLLGPASSFLRVFSDSREHQQRSKIPLVAPKQKQHEHHSNDGFSSCVLEDEPIYYGDLKDVAIHYQYLARHLENSTLRYFLNITQKIAKKTMQRRKGASSTSKAELYVIDALSSNNIYRSMDEQDADLIVVPVALNFQIV